MKFKIYKPKEEKEEIFFKLEQERDSIKLVAVDEEGKVISDGYILRIKTNGRIYLYPAINEKTGLSLDEEGRIKLD